MDFNISKTIAEKLKVNLNIKNVINRNNEMSAMFYSVYGDILGTPTGIKGGIPEQRLSVLIRAEYRL